MLGGIQIIWSTLAFGVQGSLFTTYLDVSGMALQWGVIMLCNGLLLLIGSMFPLRRCRQIGLVLSGLCLMALGVYFFQLGLFTPVTMLLPFLSVMAIIILLSEVQGKPRG